MENTIEKTYECPNGHEEHVLLDRDDDPEPIFCRHCGGPLHEYGKDHLPGVFESMYS